ncbi:MAG: hypothetical protein HY023_08470 [Chloroflexi bacterium]|nr:hypothetical protein [Chloroflexota bacterium]MBI3762058.1 hypothetical protein [Chloroflexota bacterium]
MTLPSLFFAAILSTLYGAAFHVWQGGGANRMLFYLIAAWIGFAIGHAVGGLAGVTFGAIGPLNAGTATLGSLLTLFLARWFLGTDTFKQDDSE